MDDVPAASDLERAERQADGEAWFLLTIATLGLLEAVAVTVWFAS